MTKIQVDSVTAILKACRESVGLDVWRLFHGSHERNGVIEYTLDIRLSNKAYRRELNALVDALENMHLFLSTQMVDRDREIYWHLF